MQNTLPLVMLHEGKEAKIFKIYAGRGLMRRLIEMGFTKNSNVKMLKSDRGCLIVIVGGSKYALSKGIAMKIMVVEN